MQHKMVELLANSE